MTIINYDRELAKGLVAAVEDGNEVRSVEFYEHLVVEGLITIDVARTPLHQLQAYIDSRQGRQALEAWAKEEAIDVALAE